MDFGLTKETKEEKKQMKKKGARMAPGLERAAFASCFAVAGDRHRYEINT